MSFTWLEMYQLVRARFQKNLELLSACVELLLLGQNSQDTIIPALKEPKSSVGDETLTCGKLTRSLDNGREGP